MLKNAYLIERLTEILEKEETVVFSLLFGSYARVDHQIHSDLDIAVEFGPELTIDKRLILKEDIKGKISQMLEIPSDTIDLIDIQTIDLSLSSTIVEEGLVLKGDGCLSLFRFYSRIWSGEEDFYWRLNNENRALSS